MRFLASEAAAATGGHLIGPDVMIDGVSFDSRSLQAGQLFVPIVAERDGHDFIDGARQRGAAAHLTAIASQGGSAIEVDDTAQALLALGHWGRKRLTATVIGITGSVGKTSTKDLAKAALEAGLRTAANERSFNNDQGLPVTILNAPDDVEALVLEMGMRGFGQIARLCAIGEPMVGVVTRIAAAHTELVGDIEGVVRAKGELIEALPPSGTAILNGDDPNVSKLANRTSATAMRFGSLASNDVQIDLLELDHLARPRFTLRTPWGTTVVALGVSGLHMASNAAAALCVSSVCGVDLESAALGVAKAGMSPWRMEVTRARSGALVINDAYNANPASMTAAIDALSAMKVTGRRVAVLGVMAELTDPEADHLEIAALLAQRQIELVPVGTALYGAPQVADPLHTLDLLTSDDAVLIKGSRVAGLERLVQLIVGE